MTIHIPHLVTGNTVYTYDGDSLAGATLRGANLIDANLTGADLRWAMLSGANLTGCMGLPDAPAVPDIKAKILVDGKVNMSAWHTCETTHCLAGWAVHLAGAAGYALEEELGASLAGALIFHASIGEVPDFYSSTEAAIDWLRKDTTP